MVNQVKACGLYITDIYEKGVLDMFGLVPFGSRNGLAKNNEGPRSVFDIFNEPFFQDDWSPFAGWSGSASFKVDVKDNGQAYELEADLPGLKKEDIHLSYDNSYLTISAQQQGAADQKDSDGDYIRRERRSGAVSRSFYIDNIDASKITAEFHDGVLQVMLPKLVEESHATQIEIR